MSREQKEYNEIVGITEDGEIVMLDYIFRDTMHGEPFNGAVGTIFCQVDQESVDDRNDPEFVSDLYDLEHMWKEAVALGQTQESLENYVQSCIDESDGYFFGHDTSYIEKIPKEFQEKYFPQAVTFECVGGGRCFGRKLRWHTILRPDLLKLIEEVEAQDEKS